MQRATTDILYYEHSPFNKPTMTVKPGEWFEVATQMNRGPDSDTVPEDIRDLYNTYRSDSQPTDKGNASSGCIYVEGAQPGQMLTVHIRSIETHPVGYNGYRGSTGAAPGFMGPSGVGPQYKVVRIADGRIIRNDRLSFPLEPMLGVVGVAPEREARHNGWAGEWGQVVHCNSAYRGPAFSGDATFLTATIIDKLVDEQGRNIVQVDCKMSNQLGTVMATATAEIELPKK